MQPKTQLIETLSDTQTRVFSAQLDGVEIYRSQYTKNGIEILSESLVDPKGHRLLTFHVNDNPMPVHSVALTEDQSESFLPTVPTATFF